MMMLLDIFSTKFAFLVAGNREVSAMFWALPALIIHTSACCNVMLQRFCVE